ncbi:Zinc transporter 2-like [Oopsacas minuta]|uniref:Zinc transporter 2-like n=1 Tax=Oopsacas minuta TaxID=111878 RepID=A0AAV7JB63_9METZ|nr:Zinc transporter 2-like [Oopsacas minuta]
MAEVREISPLLNEESTHIQKYSPLRTARRRADSLQHCECHVPEKKGKNYKNKEAQTKLVIAALLALSFAIAEAVGGYLSSSLAVLSDAAHMLSDFSGILVSLLSLWISRKRATKSMSFGFHRAEVMGAVISVLIIWLVTGILVYEGIQRVIHQDFEIEADIMLIISTVGLYVNVFMALILQTHVHHMEGLHKHHTHDEEELGHAHEHEHINEQDHEHDHNIENGINCDTENLTEVQVQKGKKLKIKQAMKWTKSKLKHSHSHDHNENINLRAALIHCIGDIVQSIGVIIAAYIIRFKPEWKIVDPICTFIFSILVLFTTLNIMKDALHVLMEGTPKNINYLAVKKNLTAIEGVEQAHTLNIWSISSTRTALAGHIVIKPQYDSQEILKKACQLAKIKYDIDQCTLQVEIYDEAMDTCRGCQSEADSTDSTRTKNRIFKILSC